MSRKIEAGSTVSIKVGSESKRLWGVMFVNIPIENSENLNKYYLASYNNKGLISMFYRLGLLNSIGESIPASLSKNMPVASNAILVIDRGLRFLIIPELGCYAGTALFNKNGTLKTDIILVSMLAKSQLLTPLDNKSKFVVFSMNSKYAILINLETGEKFKQNHEGEYYKFNYQRNEYQRKICVTLGKEKVVTTLSQLLLGEFR